MRAPHVLLAVLVVASPALAQEKPETPKPETPKPETPKPDAPATGEYHTPRAGEPLKTEVFGEPVDVAERDRSNVVAGVIGLGLYSPRIGNDRTDPLIAFYFRRISEDRFLRGTVSILRNDVELAERRSGVEGVLRFATDTPVGGKTETIEDDEVSFDRVKAGRVGSELGFGYRLGLGGPVDNEVRADLFYETTWVYTRRSRDTGSFVQLPPDTLEHGIHLRLRADWLERNLLELPHSGFAGGADLEVLRRDRWGDEVFTTFVWTEEKTRDFIRAQAYVVAAGGLPMLSERHRFVLSLHGGWSPPGHLDRFSAFRLGSGPLTSESYDLARRPVPGLLFDQIRARDYLVSMVEYRFEALFFLYLHFRYVAAFANHLAGRQDGTTHYVRQCGHSISTAVSSGFFFSSSIYLEYSFATAQLRARDGHEVLFVLSKAF